MSAAARFVVFIALLLGAACVRHTASHEASSLAYPPAHPEVQIGKHGIGCLTIQQRNTPGEASYSVADIGRVGVPSLTPAQRSMVRRIQQYVHSETLRFTFVSIEPHFIVFDATDGPCADLAPGYWVLNDKWANAFYEPGEAPGFVHAVPGEAAPTPGPWMSPDRKQLR